MSPYLFVLCIERLSHMIKDEIARKRWKGVRLSRYGPEISHLFFADDMILVAEANEDQIGIINECLRNFEDVSGQKVSLQKSQIFFSKNVEPITAQRIEAAANIGRVEDLGRYLGVPSIHGRVTQSLFGPLLDKVENRLAGWRGKYLTLAGRRILAQSVLSSIPFYTMQTTLLPKGVCDSIEKKIRTFIWNNNIHLVSWERLTKVKREGGFGLRSLEDMNTAFLAKMGWRLIKFPEALWARTLLSKYMHGKNEKLNFYWKHNASNLWRGICKANPILRAGIRKTVRSGHDTLFWKDNWLKGAGSLNDESRILHHTEIDKKVVDYWIPGVGWDWQSLDNLIDAKDKVALSGYDLDRQAEGGDGVYWGLDSSGIFTVTSAYDIAIGADKNNGKGVWESLWKIKVPNKMCVLLWLIKHGRLMTNSERRKRGLTMNARCAICNVEEETIDHLVRKCGSVRNIWKALLPRDEITKLENLGFEEWLDMHIMGKVRSRFGTGWTSLFAITVWWNWRWRCNEVFQGERWDHGRRTKWLVEQYEEVKEAFTRARVGKARVGHNARTEDGEDPGQWVTVNTDASFISICQPAGCGGVMRTKKGDWIRGFSCTTRAESATHGEIWAVYLGLKWAWECGIKKLWLRSDALNVVNWINGERLPLGPCGELVNECKVWMSKDWEVRLVHVPRELNNVADRLARIATCRNCDWIEFMKIPSEIREQVELEKMQTVFGLGAMGARDLT